MLLESTLQHVHFQQAAEEAKVCAIQATPGTVIFVSGPTGAGKTTLLKYLCTSLYQANVDSSKSQIPLVSVQATNSESGYFSSKDFYSRLLGQLGDPFRRAETDMDWSGAFSEASPQMREFLSLPFWSSIRISLTETKIRRAFECLARAVGLKAAFIDEGQSMCLTHAKRSPSDHLESLKCLAGELGILIFIFGTYDLLEIWNHSAQLNRRTHLIHLRRYDANLDEDRDAFFSVLRMYGKSLKFKSAQVLSNHAEEILDWTYGVFGEVDALFTRAGVVARMESRSALTWADIVRARYTPSQMERLRFEIETGERRVRGEVPRRQTTAAKHRNRRPGTRNPVRDRRNQKT